ncbi:MAG: hypothetical protein LUC39_07635 [Clostridiales bacterium]|nr:hypothetical protein [Clostridiales bacterium]
MKRRLKICLTVLLVLAVAFVCSLQLRWLSRRCASRPCQREQTTVELWEETAEE